MVLRMFKKSETDKLGLDIGISLIIEAQIVVRRPLLTMNG